MRTIAPLLSLAALLAALPVAAAAPRIACDEPEFDFGELSNTEKMVHEYVLRNTGDLTLEITNTTSSCGCALAKLPKNLVPPGESVALQAEIDLHGRSGPLQKTIQVFSNDPQTPVLALKFKGTAVPNILISPTRVFLTNAPADEPLSTAVDVTFKRIPGRVLAVSSSIAQVAVRLEVLEEQKAYRVHLSTVPPLGAGRFAGSVKVTTDLPKNPDLFIGVIGSALSEILYSPEKLTVSTRFDRPITRYLAVRPGSTGPVKVESVEVPDPEIQVKILELANRQGYRVQLANITASDELQGQSVRIHTDHAKYPVIDIPFEVLH